MKGEALLKKDGADILDSALLNLSSVDCGAPGRGCRCRL
jgi:hypothetical protein